MTVANVHSLFTAASTNSHHTHTHKHDPPVRKQIPTNKLSNFVQTVEQHSGLHEIDTETKDERKKEKKETNERAKRKTRK